MARKPRPNALMPPDAGEVDKEWAKLRERVSARIPELFGIAVTVLGEEEARRKWKEAQAKPMGRPKGQKAPGKDMAVLGLYDVLATTYPVKSLPRRIGLLLDQFKGEYGLSPTAIEKHVRRRLKERSQPPIRRGLINRTPR